MKAGNFQFIKGFTHSFLKNSGEDILNKEIEIIFNKNKELDNYIIRDNKIIYKNPSSVAKFLYNVVQILFSDRIISNTDKDKFAFALVSFIKNYIYADYRTEKNTLPLLLSFDKVKIPSFIINELVQPIIGKFEKLNILSFPCNFTDSTRIIESKQDFDNVYNTKYTISKYEFPLILINSNIYNQAVTYAELIMRQIEFNIGENKAQKFIKNILFKDEHIFEKMITICKLMSDNDLFIPSFITCLNIYSISNEIEDNLNKLSSSDGKYTPNVWKQWTQWSMLMGLIEKQLGPMRGSMWPASDSIKPHEDKLRAKFRQIAKQKNKKELNFEEMLEAARDVFNHNATEPGVLLENMIKDNGSRIWV